MRCRGWQLCAVSGLCEPVRVWRRPHCPSVPGPAIGCFYLWLWHDAGPHLEFWRGFNDDDMEEEPGGRLRLWWLRYFVATKRRFCARMTVPLQSSCGGTSLGTVLRTSDVQIVYSVCRVSMSSRSRKRRCVRGVRYQAGGSQPLSSVRLVLSLISLLTVAVLVLFERPMYLIIYYADGLRKGMFWTRQTGSSLV